MREIEFRALAPDKKGNLKWFDSAVADGQEVWIETKHQGIKHLKEVKALVRYTGLKDKNGVEIYEGDIVKAHSYTVTGLGKVGFNKGSFVFNKFEYPTSQVLHSFSEIEVIGNIYEHPHLLGGE